MTTGEEGTHSVDDCGAIMPESMKPVRRTGWSTFSVSCGGSSVSSEEGAVRCDTNKADAISGAMESGSWPDG